MTHVYLNDLHRIRCSEKQKGSYQWLNPLPDMTLCLCYNDNGHVFLFIMLKAPKGAISFYLIDQLGELLEEVRPSSVN